MKIFFLFSVTERDQLLSSPKRFLEDIDLVVSGLGGIDLEPLRELRRNLQILQIEEILDVANLSAKSLSRYEVEVVDELLGGVILEWDIEGIKVDIAPSLRRHLTLLVRPVVAFHLAFDHLAQKSIEEVVHFGPTQGFRLVERLDIRVLLRPSVTFGPQLETLCKIHGIARRTVNVTRGLLTPLAWTVRRGLFRIYKGWVLAYRSFSARNPPSQNLAPPTIAGVVRADTEFDSCRPILDAFEIGKGESSIVLVDDLLKSPTGTEVVEKSAFEAVRLHSYSSAVDVVRLSVSLGSAIRQLVDSAMRQRKTRKGRARDEEVFGPVEFFATDEVARRSLTSCFETVHELSLFALQLKRALMGLKPRCLLTMDFVDRWGSLVGAVGGRLGIPTLTLQNTALDEIMYAEPLGTDHMIVVNERLRENLCCSGANPRRVHDFGLPLHDRMIRIGDERQFASLDEHRPLRLLVATQPFQQEFDYNADLLSGLNRSLHRAELQACVTLKVHPREDASAYVKHLEAWTVPGVVIKVAESSLEDCLEWADVLLSRTSTGLQSALVAGVLPIAYLHRYPREVIDRLDYLSSSAVLKVETAADLEMLLRRLNKPEARNTLMESFFRDRRRYIDEFCGKMAGRATEATLDLVRKLAEFRDDPTAA